MLLIEKIGILIKKNLKNCQKKGIFAYFGYNLDLLLPFIFARSPSSQGLTLSSTLTFTLTPLGLPILYPTEDDKSFMVIYFEKIDADLHFPDY